MITQLDRPTGKVLEMQPRSCVRYESMGDLTWESREDASLGLNTQRIEAVFPAKGWKRKAMGRRPQSTSPEQTRQARVSLLEMAGLGNLLFPLSRHVLGASIQGGALLQLRLS